MPRSTWASLSVSYFFREIARTGPLPDLRVRGDSRNTSRGAESWHVCPG